MLSLDVLRWLTVKSLLAGGTWAGERVFDSPSQPAELMLAEEATPFLAVYTDEADIDLVGNSHGGGTVEAFLLIEAAVGGSVGVPPGAGEPEVRISDTDSGLEATIGFLARQANQALLDTASPWAELWRTFCPVRSKIEIRRGGVAEGQAPAVRFASRLLRYSLEVLNEPPRGEGVPEGFWMAFLALAEADADLGELAVLVRAELEGGTLLPAWRLAQKQLGLTEAAVAAMGLAPIAGPAEGEPEDDGAELGQVSALDDAGGAPLTVLPGEELA